LKLDSELEKVAQRSGVPDWHPGSVQKVLCLPQRTFVIVYTESLSTQVQDVIRPSLYPYVHGVMPLAADKRPTDTRSFENRILYVPFRRLFFVRCLVNVAS